MNDTEQQQQFHFFDPSGIFSLRANGFRTASTALSELVDNSIQANARNVEIALIQRPSEGPRKNWLVDEVLISDDGDGMTKEILSIALRFGGGTRHGAESNLGKFGMGLPNSSASQCRRFEVYTWQSDDLIHFNYFDFDELSKSKTGHLPTVERVDGLPRIAKQTLVNRSSRGTIVRWLNCDKIQPKRAATIIQKMVVPLGRTFRYYLKEGKVTITLRVFDDNGTSLSERKDLLTKIEPVDSLFLMKGCYYPRECDETGPTNEAFAAEQENIVEYDEPLGNGEFRRHKATINFSIAKPEIQANKGNNHPLSKHYKENGGLISIVRAKREININHFGFVGDQDLRHRWWSCEVCFEPISDELFGLDNSKQNVHNFRKIESGEIRDSIEDDAIPSLAFMSKISNCISANITEMMKIVRTRGKGVKSKPCTNPQEKGCKGALVDGKCSVCGYKPQFCEQHPTVPLDKGKCHLCEFAPVPPVTPPPATPPNTEEREELKKFLIARFKDYEEDEQKLNLAIDWFFTTPHNQMIIFKNLGTGPLYSYQTIGMRTIIEVNDSHKFYDLFVEPAFKSEETDQLTPILLLFGSLVEAEKMNPDGSIEDFRSLIGINLNKAIRHWNG